MTTVSDLELRDDFPRIETLLLKGEEIQVTKSGKVIARIVPEATSYPPLPDFLARIKEIYGDKVFEVSGADLLSEERNRL